ncbi:MAG: hypothetical protein JXR76_15270 [Deltaproteobacteria bacterium]|nr:hypothetical protein [Deltaproteobacteria bacterium]
MLFEHVRPVMCREFRKQPVVHAITGHLNILWGIAVFTFFFTGCDLGERDAISFPYLLVDDFGKKPDVKLKCNFDTQYWPDNDSGDTSSDSGNECSVESRPNSYGGCPRIFSDEKNGESWGRICTAYESASAGGPDAILRINFYFPLIGDTLNDTFVCFVEPVQPKSRGLPLNLFAFGVYRLTFWVMATQDNTDFEISLIDSAKRETLPKVMLSSYVNSLPANEWRKVSIPVTALVQRPTLRVEEVKSESVSTGYGSGYIDTELVVEYKDDDIDASALASIVFCFSSKDFVENDSGFERRGSVYIDQIMFEP